MAYTLMCSNGHPEECTLSELEYHLYQGDPICTRCSTYQELQTNVVLECPICTQVYNAGSFDEVRTVLDTACEQCLEMGDHSSDFQIQGSWGYAIAQYDWSRDGKNPQALERSGRTDYWEGVIHFCTRDQFISIYRDRILRAQPTGYFTLPAVCLTETPIASSRELQQRHGEYGFLFKKSQLIAIGGNPAIYLAPEILRAQETVGTHAKLKPFVNLLRVGSLHPDSTHYDFLHEREWRVPHDISLDQHAPFAVIIPGSTSAAKFSGQDWGFLLDAANEFSELW
jgi:hypothetical protein